MLTKKQLEIFSVFKEDVLKEFTFREIMEKSGQKSNNAIQLAIKAFSDEGILVTKKTGDVNTYRPDTKNNLALAYLNLINEYEIAKKKLPVKVLDELEKRVSKYTEFFIMVVFGSHAKGMATRKSDVDIAIIVDADETKKNIVPALETVKRREIVSIDYHVFTTGEFIEMLREDYENVGKQVFKYNLAYHGYMEYVRLTAGAYE